MTDAKLWRDLPYTTLLEAWLNHAATDGRNYTLHYLYSN